jgi:hypothetical protein
MQAPWSTRQHSALQAGVTAEQPEIAEMGPTLLELVNLLLGLMSTALDRGAGGIRGVQLLGMVTLVLGYYTLETLPNPYPSRRVPLPLTEGKGCGGYGYGYRKKTQGLPGPYTR